MLGPAQMRLHGGRSAREPDLFFLSVEHYDRRTRLGIEGPADLVIEIISDDSDKRDHVEKLEEYAEAGVPEYWVFDPRRGHQEARFYLLTESGTYREVTPGAGGRYSSTVLPGFWIEPDWLWRDPLPDPLALLKRIAPEALRAFVLAPDVESASDKGDA
jgi:Uma2 family endonuclease